MKTLGQTKEKPPKLQNQPPYIIQLTILTSDNIVLKLSTFKKMNVKLSFDRKLPQRDILLASNWIFWIIQRLLYVYVLLDFKHTLKF